MLALLRVQEYEEIRNAASASYARLGSAHSLIATVSPVLPDNSEGKELGNVEFEAGRIGCKHTMRMTRA